MQLQLAHADLVPPAHRRSEQCGADAAAAVRGGDHQAEIGDVTARRVLVTRDRQAPDDEPVVLGDEDRRVRIAADRAQVAPLVGGVPPAVCRHEPALRLGADRVAERLQALRVGRLGAADDHSTTTPAPPRRGSPAAASLPSSSVTAAAPPK